MYFLITAGGTREYIDPVRFISNASSGKMGYALSQAAFDAGDKVTLISASDMQPPVGVDFVGVESAKDMLDAVKKYFKECDCLIMAAAVSDYAPVRCSKTKIKKGHSNLIIKLKPTADILAWSGRNKRKNQIIVGFALEDKSLKTNAEKKVKAKHLDMIVANKSDTIGADKTTVHIKTPGSKWVTVKDQKKSAIAKKIIEMIKKI